MSSSTTPHDSADLIDSLPYIDRDLEDVAGECRRARRSLLLPPPSLPILPSFELRADIKHPSLAVGLRETAESLIQAEMAKMGGVRADHPRLPKGLEKELFEVSSASFPNEQVSLEGVPKLEALVGHTYIYRWA